MSASDIFDDFNLDAARALFNDPTRLSILPAITFRNAVQAFLDDARAERGAQPITRLLCVDTTEVAAYAQYSHRISNAFSFGDILGQDAYSKSIDLDSLERIINLDRLITYHLLFDRKDGFILLDSYAEEVASLTRRARARESELVRVLEKEQFTGNLANYNEERVSLLEKWLNDPKIDAAAELDIFQNTFLPRLRTDFADKLYESKGVVDRYNKFDRGGKYYFATSKHAGGRSFLNLLSSHGVEVRWEDFLSFSRKSESQRAFEDITSKIAELLSSEDYSRYTPSTVSIRNDARAFGTLHVLNEFMRRNGHPVRAELVSRAPRLHDLRTLLPDKVNVTVRHPLLMPEIYNFAPASLVTLSKVFQKVAGSLDSLDDAVRKGDVLQHYREIKPLIRAAASELVSVLSNVLVVQQAIEQDDTEALLQTVVKEIGEQHGKHLNKKMMSEKIATLFNQLRDGLEKQTDPFSLAAIDAISDNNKRLLQLDLEAGGALPAHNVTFRYLDVSESPTAFPKSFIAFRVMGGRIPRLFHLYSSHPPAFFDVSKKMDDERVPRLSEPIPVASLIKLAQVGFDEHHGDTPEADRVAKIESTTIACVAVASLGHFATASTLASNVIDKIARHFENYQADDIPTPFSNPFLFEKDPRLFLVMKELFLIRQYCSRALAREALAEEAGIFAHTRGRAIEQFEQAERDIHLAIKMNEHAEHLESAQLSSPAGVNYFNDARFSLSSFYGWIDHYIAASEKQDAVEPSLWEKWAATSAKQLWGQHDRWTAVTWARGIENLAFRAREKIIESRELDTKRYFAYVESSALQGLLVLFLTQLAFESESEVQSLWNPTIQTQRRVFAFGEWKAWRRRFNEAVKGYSFQMRLQPLFDIVFEAIDEIDALSSLNEASMSRQEGVTALRKRYDAILQKLISRLSKIRGPTVGSGSQTFYERLVRAIISKAERLKTR